MARRPRRYSDEQLIRAVGESQTMSDILRALGLVPRGANYESVRAQMERLGLGAPARGPRRERTLASVPVAELTEVVRPARSAAQVAAALGISASGSTGRLAARIRELGLDTSHFRGQAWRRGSTTPVVRARPLAELLVNGSPCHTSTLKGRLIQEGRRRRSVRAACCTSGVAS